MLETFDREAIARIETFPIYAESIFFQKLLQQSHESNRQNPYVFFGDIDGTILVHDSDPKYASATADLDVKLLHQSIPLIAVTGREYITVREMQDPTRDNLPMFDIIVGAVGTEIFVRQTSGRYQQDEGYWQLLRERVGFKREFLYPVCIDFKNRMKSERPDLQLEFQPLDDETYVAAFEDNPTEAMRKYNLAAPQEFKISYRFNGAMQDRDWLEGQFRTMLDVQGFPHVLVVISHDSYLEKDRIRYNVDILPITKDFAINYLVDMSKCYGVVAGDSGNDLLMLTNAGSAAIVVGGSKHELVEALDRLPTQSRGEFLQVLDNGRVLYRGDDDATKKGPESILDGLRYFGFI